MSRESFNYSHGDTGTQPSNSLNFEANERPDAEHFDWWWNNVIDSINGHAEEFDRLDSNDDGQVDAADTADHATQADNATTVKGNDIDSDGDGRVDAADHATNADQATNADTVDGYSIHVGSSPPSNPSENDIWIETS